MIFLEMQDRTDETPIIHFLSFHTVAEGIAVHGWIDKRGKE